MSALRIVNLLDDFALGGVTNGLRVFDCPELSAIGSFSTLPVDPTAILAPRIEADVIITHFPPNWRRLPFFASLRLRNPGARLIHVEHSYSKEWERLHVPHLARFRTMMKTALKCFDEVVVVSKAQKQWLQAGQLVAADKVHVIHPYSNIPGLADVPELRRTKRGRLIIGAYGRFCEAKGFELLIDAMKRTDAIDHLELVLGGFGEADAALRSRAEGCPQIRFAGKVTHVAGFLANCHVVAVPSRFEAYGQVANEAREAGRPILVSQAGGLPEQVGEAGLIVDCNDADALLAALQSLRAQPLEAMGRAGRRATALDRSTRLRQWRELLSPQWINQPGGRSTLGSVRYSRAG